MRAGASAPASPSASRPKAPTSRSPPGPSTRTTLAGSLNETAARLERYGATVAVVVADLTDDDDRARIVPAAVEPLGGPIDILVNNAAAAMYVPPVGDSR